MKYKNKSLQISCDGGAATGKSTGARMIAKKFNLKFLSSGLLYRYASFLILKHKPRNVINFLKKKFKNLDYKKFQINFSKKNKKCCIEGRDISTKILPDSDVKFFFVCNINIAAKRRYKELKKNDPKLKLQNVKKALRIRNILDTKRKNSPLLRHRDSIEIDTGKLNKQAMVAKMTKCIKKKI